MSDPVRVQVFLFAQLKDRLGDSEVSVALPARATGRDLMNALARRSPAAEPLLKVSRLAVGQEYVPWDHPLRAGEEVAVVPPVSGG